MSAKISEDLANELSKDNEVFVLSPEPSRPKGFTFPNTYEVVPKSYNNIILNSYTHPDSSLIGRMRESVSFGLATYIYLINNRDTISVVYANTWPLFAQLFTVLASIRIRVPIVIHVQDIYPEALLNSRPILGKLVGFIPLKIDKYVLRSATALVAISSKMKRYLVETRNLANSKITTILNWQNISNTSEVICLKDRENFTTFMYLGNIGPVAGCDLLIDAFYSSNINKTRLVIAGSGTKMEELVDYVKRNQIPNVEFWPVPDGKVQEFQSRADFLLLPIKKGAAKYSVPSKLAAYMLSGKTILAMVDKDSDTSDMILEAGCGFVVEPDNIFEAAEMFRKASELTSAQKQEYGDNAISYARKHFDSLRNVSNLRDLIISSANA